MRHECWAGAQGVDCVRQAIVIRYQKVGIRASGHKTHTHMRGRAGLIHVHTQLHIELHFNISPRKKNRKSGQGRDKRSQGQKLRVTFGQVGIDERMWEQSIQQRKSPHMPVREQKRTRCVE